MILKYIWKCDIKMNLKHSNIFILTIPVILILLLLILMLTLCKTKILMYLTFSFIIKLFYRYNIEAKP